MPTTDIIGYLWSNRQDLSLSGVADVLEFAADLQRTGLRCVDLDDVKVMGTPVAVTVQWQRLEPAEWAVLVEDAIVTASASHTIEMLHEEAHSD